MKTINSSGQFGLSRFLVAALMINLFAFAGIFTLQAQMPPQEAPPQAQPPAREAPPPAQVPDQTLEQVADAYQAISDIQNQLQAELAGIEDQGEIQRRIQAAQPQMEQAVEATGLEVEEYERIIQSVNHDQALRNALIEKLDARQQTAGDGEQQEQPAVEVADADIAKAAAIYQEVQGLNQQLQQDLAGVEDQAVIQQRVAEAEASMKRIVQDEGMDVERYSAIMQVVQRDQEMMQKFMRHLGH